MAYSPSIGGDPISPTTINSGSGYVGYVGPWSPEAYTAANQMVATGNTTGAPWNPDVINAAQQIIAQQGGDTANTNTKRIHYRTGPAYDPVAAKAAADAAKAASLRGEITNIVNTIKGIFDSRYGSADKAAAEQSSKLDTRFGQESQDVAGQVTDQSNTAGASFAGRGTRDSSDYGNTVDTIKKGGEKQIRDLGQELADNKAKIGSWVAGQKASYDAQKGGLDSVLAHLAESTDPAELTSLRNTLDSRIAELQADSTANNTQEQNISALQSIAPTTARSVQLQTTLASIVGGSADPGLKASIGQALIQNSGLSADEQQKMAMAFQSDLSSSDPNKQQA